LANAEKVFDKGRDEAEQIKQLEKEKADLRCKKSFFDPFAHSPIDNIAC